MPAELIIFDMDGVLTDSERLACKLVAEVLNELDYPISEEDVERRFMGVAFLSSITPAPLVGSHPGASHPLRLQTVKTLIYAEFYPRPEPCRSGRALVATIGASLMPS